MLQVAALVLLGCRPPPTSAHDALTAASLRGSVEVLASDAFAGRKVLEPGREAAAEWLIAALDGTDLQPLPGAPSLRVPVPLGWVAWDLPKTRVLTGDHEFLPGVDFWPFDTSASGTVHDNAIVFVGYGYDPADYDGLDVKGRVVLALEHGPSEGTGSGDVANTSGKTYRAQREGAAGFVVVPDPLNHAGPDVMGPSAPRFRMPQSDEGTLVSIRATRDVGQSLIGPDGRSLADLQRALNDGVHAPALSVKGAPVGLIVTPDDDDSLPGHGENILAVLPGTDLADEWVVVGAHYDHVGQAEGDGTRDTIYNGADDNASGSAVVLGLATALCARRDPPRRTVVFAWFDAEEAGLLGSDGALEEGHLPVERLVAMINFDMVGRNPGRPLEIGIKGFSGGASKRVLKAAAAERVDVRLPRHPTGTSDYSSFEARDVPVLFFFTGRHPDYHEPSDEADRLDYDRMERIAGVGWRLLVDLADGTWTPQP